MSGIGYQYNKFHSCSGCPDRTIEPNCHATCSGYLYRQAEWAKANKQRLKESEYNGFKVDRVNDSKKKAGIK